MVTLENELFSTNHPSEQANPCPALDEVLAKCRQIFGSKTDSGLELFLTTHLYLLDGLQEKLLRLHHIAKTLIRARHSLPSGAKFAKSKIDEVRRTSEEADNVARELFGFLSLEASPPSLCAVLISSLNQIENLESEEPSDISTSELNAWVRTLAPDELACFVKTESTLSRVIQTIRQGNIPSLEDLKTLIEEVDFLHQVKLRDLVREIRYQRLLPILMSELFEQITSQDFLIDLALELDAYKRLPDGYMVTRVIHSMNNCVERELEFRILIAQVNQVRELGEERTQKGIENIRVTCDLLSKKIQALISEKVSEANAQELESVIWPIFAHSVENVERTLISLISSGIDGLPVLNQLVEEIKEQLIGQNGSMSIRSGLNNYVTTIITAPCKRNSQDSDGRVNNNKYDTCQESLIEVQREIVNRLSELIPEFFGGLGRFCLLNQRSISELESNLDLFFSHLIKQVKERPDTAFALTDTINDPYVQKLLVEHLAGKMVAGTLNHTVIETLAQSFVLGVNRLLLEGGQTTRIDGNTLRVYLFGSDEKEI